MEAIKDGSLIRYRCHTGHAYSVDSLLAAITEKTEHTLWNAVREMEEAVMLLNQVGDHYAENNHPHEAALYFQKAKEALQRSQRVRALILHQELISIEKIENIENKQLKDT
jgi:two-component system chemotaxis response regulator CheB